jgi:hypothetical protein
MEVMMKKFYLLLSVLFLTATLSLAAEPAHKEQESESHEGCPARRAAQLGHDPIDAFHQVLAPVWHNAWPEKNYQALLEVGPKFQKAFTAIAKLNPDFKTETRREAFVKVRNDFSKLVELYAAAAEKGDTAAVYELMPKLHDAFEATARSLLPVSFPEIEGVKITLNLILQKHLPADNMEGIIGSTETLLAKIDALTDTTAIPDELKDKQAEIMDEITAMKKLAQRMKECCDKKDMDEYKQHTATLNKKLQEFFEKYI